MADLLSLCRCDACGADLRDSPIPTKHLALYGGSAICNGCGGARHYSRRIAMYDPDRDRTVAWRCPDCGHEETRRQVLHFRSEARRG